MDEIAIISDVHGNLEALTSVLEDIKERNINKIFCLGDLIVKGTHQQECIDIIKNKCEVVIKGNCDEYFTEDICKSIYCEKDFKRYEWIRNKLNYETVEYLRNLPYCHEFYMSGRLIRLLHAHPEKINTMISNISTFDKYYELFLPSKNTISQEKTDIVIYGHTHVPFMQKIYNRVILNTGSVGNAIDVYRNEEKDGNVKNTTVANYIILKGKYRNMQRFYDDLKNKGIDINKI
ncbi:MAG: metallophosphoesterase family protein [Bacilli bacterium]